MSDDNNEDPNKKSFGEKRKQNNDEEPEPLDLSSRSPLKRSRSHDPGQENDRSPQPDEQRSRSVDRVPLGACVGGGYTPTIIGITPLPPRLPLPTNRPRQPALSVREIEEREIEAAKTLLELRNAFIQPRPPSPPPEMPLPSQPRKPMHAPPVRFVGMRPARLEMPPLIPIPPAMRARLAFSSQIPRQPRFMGQRPTAYRQTFPSAPGTSRGATQVWPNITLNFPHNNQPLLIGMNPPPPGTVPFPFGWPVVGVPLPQPMVQIQPQPVVSIGFYPQPQNIVPTLNIGQHLNSQQQPIFRHPPAMRSVVQNRPMGPFMSQPMETFGHGTFGTVGNRPTQQRSVDIWRPFQLPGQPSSIATSAVQTTVYQPPFVQSSLGQRFVPIPNPTQPPPGNFRSAEVINVSQPRLIHLPRSRNTTTSTYFEQWPTTPRNQIIPTSPKFSPPTNATNANAPLVRPAREIVSQSLATPTSNSVQSAIVQLNEYVSRIMDNNSRRISSPRAVNISSRPELVQRFDFSSTTTATYETNQHNQTHVRRSRNERVMRRPHTPRGAPFYSRCPFQVSLPPETTTSASSSVTQNEHLIYPERPERAESPTRELMGTPQHRFAQFIRPDRAKSTSQTSTRAASQSRYSSSWPPVSPNVVTPRRMQQPAWPQCPTPLYHQYNSTTYLPNIPQSPRVGYNPPRPRYFVPTTVPAVTPDKHSEESPVIEHPVVLRISEDPEDPNNWDVDVNKILEILQNVNFDTSDDEMDSENAN